MRRLAKKLAIGTAVISCVLPVLTSSGAHAAVLKAITAKVPSGLKLVALSKNGVMTVGTVKSGTTSVIPSTSSVTLHLVSSSGAYAGPVVVGGQKVGKVYHAILGVKAGASIGKITYSSASQFGKATVAASSTVTSIWATASSKYVPIGAGSLGYTPGVASSAVRTSGVHALGASDASAAGGDTDNDGIPNAFDADANGDGVLNNVDPTTAAAVKAQPGAHPFVFSDFFVDLGDIVRVSDAASLSQASQVLQQKLKFVFGMPTDNGGITNVSVDCQGITWCPGATVFPVGNAPMTLPLWSSIDLNNDGTFYDIAYRTDRMTPDFENSIKPNTAPTDIKPGSVFNFVNTYTDGRKVTIPSALTAFFLTAAAPKTIGNTSITYPVTAGLGTQSSPIPTGNGTSLRIEAYRPLRPTLPKESGTLGMKEMGGLKYYVTVTRVGDPSNMPQKCTADAYSAKSSNLTDSADPMMYMMKDTAADTNPGTPTTVAFTVDLSKCGISNVVAGNKFFVDLNVSDLAMNNVISDFYAVVG